MLGLQNPSMSSYNDLASQDDISSYNNDCSAEFFQQQQEQKQQQQPATALPPAQKTSNYMQTPYIPYYAGTPYQFQPAQHNRMHSSIPVTHTHFHTHFSQAAASFNFNMPPFSQTPTPHHKPQPLSLSRPTPLSQTSPNPPGTPHHFNYKSDMHINENNSVQFSKPKLIRNVNTSSIVTPGVNATTSTAAVQNNAATSIRSMVNSDNIPEKKNTTNNSSRSDARAVVRDQSVTSTLPPAILIQSKKTSKEYSASSTIENNEKNLHAVNGKRNAHSMTPHHQHQQVRFEDDLNAPKPKIAVPLQEISNENNSNTGYYNQDPPNDCCIANRQIPSVYSRYYQSNSASPLHPLQTVYKCN